MRFQASTFLQQAIARGGAILENDGEVVLPPVFQPIIEVGLPVFANTAVVGIMTTSFFGALSADQIGASAGGANLDVRSFGAGVWKIDGRFLVQFNGTINTLGGSQLRIVDPAGVSQSVALIDFVSGTVAGVVVPVSFWISFAQDGWVFRIDNAPTVAFDTVISRFTYLAKKIL